MGLAAGHALGTLRAALDRRHVWRWLVIGRMGGRHWSAVVTFRRDRIRIISVDPLTAAA